MVDDRETGEDDKLDEQITGHTRQCYLHTLVAALMLFVLVGTFAGGLVWLKASIETAAELKAVEPEGRFEAMSRRIADTREKVEQQYADYKAKMDNPGLYAVQEKFDVMYQVSRQGAEDYRQLLSLYQQAMYQVASRTRGSGEWYFYFERDLKEQLQRQGARQAVLQRYLSRQSGADQAD